MKRTKDGCRAHMLETILVPKTDKNLRRDRNLYCIDDHPGLYLRISKEDEAKGEAVSAWWDGAVHEFVRARSVEAELAEAGIWKVEADDDREHGVARPGTCAGKPANLLGDEGAAALLEGRQS